MSEKTPIVKIYLHGESYGTYTGEKGQIVENNRGLRQWCIEQVNKKRVKKGDSELSSKNPWRVLVCYT